jgi:valyl-tRNA synthetase
VLLPLMEREIPIVADEYADPEMGSGAVKVTPAHDPNDYEIGKRHDLAEIAVIGFDAMMTSAAGRFAGQERYECRSNVVSALESAGLLERTEEYEHAVPHHDKCGTVIEPLPMEQWFMDMKALAEKTHPFLEHREIAYVPDRFREYAIDWLDDIRDWALSRQIWWGHRIPAWYCVTCSGGGITPSGDLPRDRALAEGSFQVSVEAGAKPIVQREPPDLCDQCRGSEFVQDPDVLDTWFSSALWPFATLGWPQSEESLDYFYPTDLMITGRDILYLWVLRMAFTSLELTGKVPFKTVLVHPTVMTRDGRRMSKSLGTGLNPMDLVRLYGADATRYSLLHQAGAMQDIRFDAEIADNEVKSSQSAKSGQAFCNKLWNAARFVLLNLEGYEPVEGPSPSAELSDRWIRSSLARTIDRVDEHQEKFRFSEVTRALYSFLWNDYCDWYVELAKPRLRGPAPERALAQEILVEVLEQALRLMHPVMPFITEAIWQALPRHAASGEAIMTAAWPAARSEDLDEAAMAAMTLVQEVVSAIRNIRGELRVPPGRRIDVKLSAGPASAELLGRNLGYVETLALAETAEVGSGFEKPPESASALVRDVEIHVPLEGLIDAGAERRRLKKEIDKLDRLLRGLDSKLNQSAFLERAPGEVVERERLRQTEYRESLARLEASLDAIGP